MADQYKIVREFAYEKIEVVVMLLVLFVIASFFYPEIRMGAYVSLAFLAVYFVLQLLLQAGIITEVPEYKRAVIFRLGHFHRIGGPGWVLLTPVLERADIVDLRVQELDLPPQEVITTDEIRATVDTVVYYQVLEPKQAILKVKEFERTVAGYVFAALRDIAADLTLNELYGELEKVNDIVKVKIEPMVEEWGITIVDVQITDLKIPEAIQFAMHQRRRAKEEWAAAQYQARSQKTAIEALADAAKRLDDRALAYLYIKEALPKLADGKSTKIFFPAELMNVAKVMTSAGVKPDRKEMWNSLYPMAMKKIGDEMEKGFEPEGEEEPKPAEKKKAEDKSEEQQ